MLTCAGKLRKNTVGEDKWKLRNLNLRHVVSVEQVFFIKDDSSQKEDNPLLHIVISIKKNKQTYHLDKRRPLLYKQAKPEERLVKSCISLKTQLQFSLKISPDKTCLIVSRNAWFQ